MFAALNACWRPPSGADNLEATVRFSLNASGALIGKPMITHSKLGSDDDLNRQFMAAVLKSLASCTPVAVTPALGAAIAGRVLTILFRTGERRAGAAFSLRG